MNESILVFFYQCETCSKSFFVCSQYCEMGCAEDIISFVFLHQSAEMHSFPVMYKGRIVTVQKAKKKNDSALTFVRPRVKHRILF